MRTINQFASHKGTRFNSPLPPEVTGDGAKMSNLPRKPLKPISLRPIQHLCLTLSIQLY